MKILKVQIITFYNHVNSLPLLSISYVPYMVYMDLICVPIATTRKTSYNFIFLKLKSIIAMIIYTQHNINGSTSSSVHGWTLFQDSNYSLHNVLNPHVRSRFPKDSNENFVLAALFVSRETLAKSK